MGKTTKLQIIFYDLLCIYFWAIKKETYQTILINPLCAAPYFFHGLLHCISQKASTQEFLPNSSLDVDLDNLQLFFSQAMAHGWRKT